MLVILGLDPGLADTGYGLLGSEGSMNRYLAHGAIHTSADLPMTDRLHRIYEELSIIITKYQPQEASIETLYFSKNSGSAMSVAHARGVLLLACALQGLPVREYAPNEIKQAVCGNGKAEKKQIQYMMQVLLGMSELPRPNHAADALAAAFCHSLNRNFPRKILGGDA